MIADHFIGNEQSARVMQKLGMKKLGQVYGVGADKGARLCDYYALSREEFLGAKE